MSFHHFGFGSPGYLLLLLLVPVLIVFTLIVRRTRSRYTVAFTNLAVLADATPRRRIRWRTYVPLALLALAIAALAAALARPHVQLLASGGGATIILLADVSGSMQATDVKPARIYAAVNAMHEFVQALPAHDKVGLVTFSDKPKVEVAPTTDRSVVDSALDVLSPEGGTALGAGVETAVRLVLSSLVAEGAKHAPGGYLPAAIVLESDGAQDRGIVTPAVAADLAKAAGIRIYGVAVGTRGGRIIQGTGLLKQVIRVLPDPSTVRMLAHETGGEAFDATNADKLNTIYRQLGSTIGQHREPTDITSWFEVATAVLLVAAVGTTRAWGGALP